MRTGATTDRRTGGNPATVLRGTVVTMDPRRPRGEALALRGDRVIAVGAAPAVAAAAGPDARVVDLGTAAVLPAFIDPHHHLALAALDRTGPTIALPPVASIAELQRRIAERLPPGDGWVRVSGLDPLALDEARPPTAAELDEACPERPLLLLSRSGHDAVANSLGLRALGLSSRSPDPFAGALGRDRRGRLDGRLVESAALRAEAVVRDAVLARDPQGWLEGCQAHARALLAAGVARVGDAAVPPALADLYAFAADTGRLPLIVHRLPVGASSLLEPALSGAETGSGPAQTPWGPAKLFVDGAAERCALTLSARQALQALAATATRLLVEPRPSRAALRRRGPVHRGRGGGVTSGVRLATDADVAAAVATAAQRGVQVALHAVGNDAVAAAVSALAPVAADLAALPGRPRIEHAMVLDARDAAAIAGVGAVVVAQPAQVRDLGDALRRWPLPGPSRWLPLRTLLDAGVEVAVGSDFPAGDGDVLAAVAAAVTRRTAAGLPLHPEEAVTVEEALRAATATAARALGVDDAGVLRVGARADLVVLSADPTATLVETLGEIAVLATYVAGVPAFVADAAPAGLRRAGAGASG